MKHIYVMLTHIRRKNNQGYDEVVEICDVVNRVNKNQMCTASVIFDCITGKVEKNRYEAQGVLTYDDMETYFREKYPKQYSQVKKIIEHL